MDFIGYYYYYYLKKDHIIYKDKLLIYSYLPGQDANSNRWAEDYINCETKNLKLQEWSCKVRPPQKECPWTFLLLHHPSSSNVLLLGFPFSEWFSDQAIQLEIQLSCFYFYFENCIKKKKNTFFFVSRGFYLQSVKLQFSPYLFSGFCTETGSLYSSVFGFAFIRF